MSTRNKFFSENVGAKSSTIKKFLQFSKISADNVRASAPFSMSGATPLALLAGLSENESKNNYGHHECRFCNNIYNNVKKLENS